MKTGDIKNIKAAKKYSCALFEAAKEINLMDKVYQDIVFVSETVNTNNELKNALFNPVLTLEDKKDVVRKLFTIHIEKLSLDFILLLIEKNRLNTLCEIISCYENLNNALKNIVKPLIISAVELNENQKERIKQKLENKMQKVIMPEYAINPEIIGGLIIEISDRTIDCSIKTKFDTMKKQLTKGNNYGSN